MEQREKGINEKEKLTQRHRKEKRRDWELGVYHWAKGG